MFVWFLIAGDWFLVWSVPLGFLDSWEQSISVIVNPRSLALFKRISLKYLELEFCTLYPSTHTDWSWRILDFLLNRVYFCVSLRVYEIRR